MATENQFGEWQDVPEEKTVADKASEALNNGVNWALEHPKTAVAGAGLGTLGIVAGSGMAYGFGKQVGTNLAKKAVTTPEGEAFNKQVETGEASQKLEEKRLAYEQAEAERKLRGEWTDAEKADIDYKNAQAAQKNAVAKNLEKSVVDNNIKTQETVAQDIQKAANPPAPKIDATTQAYDFAVNSTKTPGPGVAPTGNMPQGGFPAPFGENTPINASHPTNGPGPMPQGGSPAPMATGGTPAPGEAKPVTPAQATIQQATGTEPTPQVTNESPIGEISTNPVESGSEANPLHEPGAEAGKTQLEATKESTVQPEKKVVKGAAVPRRSKQETQVANEEMPFNKYYNQVANRLAGTENLREHPHITEQFDKAWEDVFHNVLGGKMEKSQGGAPAKIHEIEAHINANPEKYPDLVKYMSEAKQYAKGNINPKEGGFSHIGAMLGMLGAGGLGAYMVNRYGNPFQESMKKANEAMGEATGTQDLGKANKAEELSPAMRAIFTKASNPVYRKEINQQLATEKNPERIKELKRELEKAK